MPFIEQIQNLGSLSIVGLEKNTGKTECLNYILKRMASRASEIAVTSIGIDGEGVDLVKSTPKPEILLPQGCYFVTAASLFRKKKMQTLIWNVQDGETVLGPLVTAQAMESGKIMLSGPAHTQGVRELIQKLHSERKLKTCIIDGALSRLSPASPAITDAMVLATGAAVSANMDTLVRKTRYVYDLIRIPAVEAKLRQNLESVETGVWGLSKSNEMLDCGIQSALMGSNTQASLQNAAAAGMNRFFVAGAVGERFLKSLEALQEKTQVELIVKDFTRFFVEPAAYYSFIRRGGRVMVLWNTRLLAVCINPVSPEGYVLPSQSLEEKLREALQIPVYDIKRYEYDA